MIKALNRLWSAAEVPETTPITPTKRELLDRLNNLWRKLEDEGRYTDANTVSLAIDAILGASRYD